MKVLRKRNDRLTLWMDLFGVVLAAYWTWTASTTFQGWLTGAFSVLVVLILETDVKRYRRERSRRVRLPRSSSGDDA